MTVTDVLQNKKNQLSLGLADCTASIRRPASDYWSRKESYFPEWIQSHTRYGDAGIANVTINSKIRYGNLADVGDGCRQKLCIQSCGQTAAWLLLTAYRNSLLPYPMYHHRLSTMYGLATIHTLQTTDRRTTYRTQGLT